MILSVVMDGANAQIHSLQAAESAFHLRQALVAAHRVWGRAAALGLTGAHHVDAVQLAFAPDGCFSPSPAEDSVGDGEDEVLGDLVAVQNLARLQRDLGLAERGARAALDLGGDLAQVLLGRRDQLASLTPALVGQQGIEAGTRRSPG
jgi:hypothetical protein